jgi:hypothetical protein
LAAPLPQAKAPSLLTVATDGPLSNSARPPDEARSFQYFIEIAAPSLAGALEVDFWLVELPMVCRDDPALWHAVASLAGAHESYVSGKAHKKETNVFALGQFNQSIRHLLASDASRDWWRFLTASTIFICICILEDKYQEAKMHYESAYNLLRQSDPSLSAAGQDDKGTLAQNKGSRDPSFPVSLVSLRSILIGFEVRMERNGNKRVSQLKTLMGSQNKYASWREYTSLLRPSMPSEWFLARENIRHAVSAAESLFFEMALDRRRRTVKLKELYQSDRSNFGKHWAENIPRDGEAYRRFWIEMNRVVKRYKSEMERRKGAASRFADHRSAILCLELVHLTNLLYLQEFTDVDSQAFDQQRPALDFAICDLAEEIISLEKVSGGCKRSGGGIASTTVMNNLVSMVQMGYSEAVRYRALRLLRQPRTEGLWDMLMAAGYAEAIHTREKAATQEYKYNAEANALLRSGVSSPPRGRRVKEEGLGDVGLHPLAYICHSDIIYGGSREAKLLLSTYWEWLEGKPGQEIPISW